LKGTESYSHDDKQAGRTAGRKRNEEFGVS
jgi:hypothetical protein